MRSRLPHLSGRTRVALRRCAVVGGAVGLVALLLSFAFIAWPLPQGLVDYRQVSSVKVFDRHGRLLRELLSRQDGRSTPVRYRDVPPHVIDAFVAAEDHRFHRHPGVDPVAIVRAAVQNLRARRVVSGGSTLTQQLARTLVPRRRTLWGKAQEALWALRLEAHLSKEALLTQYLNRISFGNGTFGVEAASQLYFGVSTSHLSVAQAAALASLPRGPSAYDPYRHPERLGRRQRWVLERMAAVGRLSPEEARLAAAESLDLRAFSAALQAPHFVTHLAQRLDDWGLARATEVHTSLDAALQAQVEALARAEVVRLGDRGVGSAAVLVIDNATGEVLAYVGSADFFDVEHQGQNDGVQMRRQPGSALKPFAYLEAFSAGFTPASVLPDLQTHLPTGRGVYAPENYDRRVHGPVRIRQALANSYNVPAVRVAESLGPERLLHSLRAAGFGSLQQGSEHYGLGLVLGNGEVSLWETARAYAGLAQGGVVRPLRPLLRARGPDGAELPLPQELQPRRFAGAAEVALLTDVLADNAARAQAFGLQSVLRLPFPAAAKTGTSKGYADNWTVGYTRERTVAVWAGNFDGTPMADVSGITGAGPIFRAVMIAAMRGVQPAPLVDVSLLGSSAICPVSGARASHRCPAQMQEVFVRGRAPAHDCPMHAQLDPELPPTLAERCAALTRPDGTVLDLGPEYYEWARAEGLADEPWLASACRQRQDTKAPAAAAPASRGPRILYPTRNAEFVLLSDLPLADQAIPVRVRADVGFGPIEVRVDGEPVMTLTPPFVGRLPARSGHHRLSLHRPGDPTSLAETPFSVRAETRTF